MNALAVQNPRHKCDWETLFDKHTILDCNNNNCYYYTEIIILYVCVCVLQLTVQSKSKSKSYQDQALHTLCIEEEGSCIARYKTCVHGMPITRRMESEIW